mgnify:CR=1 FL=1
MEGNVNQEACWKLLGYATGRGALKRTRDRSVFSKPPYSATRKTGRGRLSNPSILIIGGGIVGLATARQLLRKHPDSEVTVLEKESSPGQHQTGHNSGVLHCGLYYTPGSLKAKLAVEGIREMTEFCAEHNVPHEICGKLVVATNEAEVARMENLYERGRANGLGGLEKLTRDQMREIEPHVGGIAALKVPQEGIVDYNAVVTALVREIESLGGQVITNARVRHLRQSNLWNADTTAGDYSADWIINCAGLHSDRVSQLAGQRRDLRIVPFRGEYFQLKPQSQHLVKHLIYPVPDPAFPFLGVHFTRLIGGGIEAGPNAVLAFAREGYRKTNVNLRDLCESLTYPGFLRMAARHWKMGMGELWRSISKRAFVKALSRLVPEIKAEHLEVAPAGVRAQALARDGSLVDDFLIQETDRIVNVGNAPSPAATASLNIGNHVVEKLAHRFA